MYDHSSQPKSQVIIVPTIFMINLPTTSDQKRVSKVRKTFNQWRGISMNKTTFKTTCTWYFCGDNCWVEIPCQNNFSYRSIDYLTSQNERKEIVYKHSTRWMKQLKAESIDQISVFIDKASIRLPFEPQSLFLDKLRKKG